MFVGRCLLFNIYIYISSITATLIIWKSERASEMYKKPYPKNTSKVPIVQRCTNDKIPARVNQKLSPSHHLMRIQTIPSHGRKNGRTLHGRLRLRPGPGRTRETRKHLRGVLSQSHQLAWPWFSEERYMFYIYIYIYNVYIILYIMLLYDIILYYILNYIILYHSLNYIIYFIIFQIILYYIILYYIILYYIYTCIYIQIYTCIYIHI